MSPMPDLLKSIFRKKKEEDPPIYFKTPAEPRREAPKQVNHPPIRTADASSKPSAQLGRTIADEKYLGCTDLTEFVVPEGVTEIGRKAFSCCVNLEKITLPSTLQIIGSNAFDGCMQLREIDIPDSVRSIGNGAFCRCKALERIKFPKGMRGAELSGGLFYDCVSLETVELPERLCGSFTNIFPHCNSLREIHLPEGITEIGSFTFQDCSLLQTIKIPSTVKILEYKAFLRASSLSEIYIPDHVSIIDAYRTFGNCTSLRKIRLPLNVTFRHNFPDEDGADAVGCCFRGCTSLQTVVLDTREFHISGEFNDAQFLLLHAKLAAEHNGISIAYVKKHYETGFDLAINKNDAELVRELLRYLPQELLTQDFLYGMADGAGMMGMEDILYIIVDYMKQRRMDTSFAEIESDDYD